MDDVKHYHDLQADSYHQHTEIVKDLGGLRAIEVCQLLLNSTLALCVTCECRTHVT